MTGHKIHVGKSFKVKDGKLIKVHQFRDASHAIRAKTSKKQKPIRRTP
ncbi:MAG: hypothetical protein IPM06_18135 [Rhizobiales bacterium]|nr:hypothetical protein [Hyphomicrobiales bacterium]